MERKRVIKYELITGIVSEVIDELINRKANFTVEFTNMTCRIETDDTIFRFVRFLRKPIVFSVAQDLKRYVDTFLGVIPKINEDNCKYYSANMTIGSFYADELWNVDINSAYPTCLLNSKLIDEKLFNRLMRLEKLERLASIGMLASKKKIFSFENGEPVHVDYSVSEYSKYFFHCVTQIGNQMFECEQAVKDFIFSWFDGIYVSSFDSAHKIKKLLKEHDYNCTITKLTDFSFDVQAEKISIRYIKGDDVKIFNIPIYENTQMDIIKNIQLPNKNKDEFTLRQNKTE